MRSRRLKSIPYIGVVLSCLVVTACSSPPSEPQRSTGGAVYPDPVIAYADLHPGDYVGIDQVARRGYGRPIRFTLNDVPGDVDAQEAQRIADARSRRRGSLLAQIVRRESVPVDSFTVGFFWSPTTGPIAKAAGTWNFRDNYVNGSAPDDIATVSVQLNDCIQVGRAYINAQDYQNKNAGPNVGYVRDAGLNGTAVVGIRDQTSGFAQNADHGTVTIEIQKKPNCGPTVTRGQFIYEHNQDGGAIVNVSAGFGLLNISYSGGATALQKSAGPLGFKIP